MKNIGELSLLKKNEVAALYVIAICMMIWHHEFGCDFRLEGYGYNSVFGSTGSEVVWWMGFAGKLCVSIFAFITGQALWLMRDGYGSLKYCLKKLLTFLTKYWLVIIAFLAMALIFNEQLPSVKVFLKNLIGLGVGFEFPYINVVHAWYVFFYIVVMLVAPFLVSLYKKVNLFGDILLSIFIYIVWFSIWNKTKSANLYGWPVLPLTLGIIAAKYKFFAEISHWARSIKGKILPFLLFLATFVITVYLYFLSMSYFQDNYVDQIADYRKYICEFAQRAFLAFLTLGFIWGCLPMINTLFKLGMEKIIVFLSGLVTWMWFIHSIFFTGTKFLQKFVYWSETPLIQFLSMFVLSALMSVVVSKLYDIISRYLGYLPLQKNLKKN